MLSSENNFTENSDQYNWLQFDLQSIDRSKTPWVIVTMHRPMYSSSKTGSTRLSDLIKKNLETLLLKHKVNFFFNGHVHFYERTCAINNSSCNDVKNFNDNWGINYFTVGSGGKLNKEKIPIHPEWSKKILFLNGIGKMDFINKTHASWKFIASKNEAILDEVLFVAPEIE
uniref:Purple acid phosphatase 21 (Trinotate prediction) n=1 Tax=Myxobolus squamalis TaxID=59785 RepID=A0A6B2G4Q6_MYXSQ